MVAILYGVGFVMEPVFLCLGDTLADKLIALIKSNPQLTQEELAEKTKVSVPSIKRAMKTLSDKGKIERKPNC